MNKKLSTAMAAAMAFGTVAPAFADQVQTRDLAVNDKNEVVVDVRKTTGKELVKTTGSTVEVFDRSEVYNSNFTPEDFSDDTLKDSSLEVVKELQVSTDKEDKSQNLYVMAKDVKASDVEVAKSILAAAKAELEAYIAEVDSKGNKVYTVEVVEENNMELTTAGTATDSVKKVAVTKVGATNPTKTYVFNGVADVTVEDLAELFAGIKGEMTFKKDQTAADYFNLNAFKYVVEQNASKFDIVKNELAADKLEVKVFAKDADKTTAEAIFTMTLDGIVLTGDNATVDTDLIIDMPATTDIDGHWAEKEIKTAMLKGHIDASASFRHKDGITRAEFAKMVCTMFGIEAVEGEEEPFHDVDKNAWYYEYVTALYNHGTTAGTVINGYGDDFRPNAEITRQEAAKMIASVFNIEKQNGNGIVDTTVEVNKEEIHVDVKTKFTDDTEIKSWADQSVELLANEKIVNGNPDGTFKPASNITRAEALLMIQRASK